MSKLFKFSVFATLALKLLLAWVIPMSGDEAYFIVWAKHLDFGYYDHPPMVGWFLHLMLYLGNTEVILRLPAILASIVTGTIIYRLLKPLDETKAALVATLYLVSPINILNVLVTTDTPLILFAFFSMAALYQALQQGKLSWYALSGMFFGLAFLSKYFAVLLGLAYLLYFIFSHKNREKTAGFVLLYLVSLPFALLNIYWNYTHCWDNILFNLYTRNEDAHYSIATIAAYLGVQLYLLTPPLLWLIFKHRTGLWLRIRRDQFQIFLFVFIVPMAVFLLLSLKKTVGLHWVLAFYPALYLLLFQILPAIALEKLLKFMLAFSALHLLAIVIIAALPMSTWQHNKLYGGIVFMFEPQKIAAEIRPYEQQNFLLATDGYSPSAIISYHYGKDFFVFGEGGLHARQDDMLTDFRPLQGRNILILSKAAPNLQDYTPYFNHVETKAFNVRSATFYLVLGYDFNYAQYRTGVLKPIKDKYYRIPAYLPHAPCYFCDKYFPGECSLALTQNAHLN
jgi:hypothetical protein